MTLGENFLCIVVLFIPVFLLILLRRFRRDMFAPSNAAWRTALVLVAATLQIITAMCVGIGGTGYFSNHYFYHSNLTTTDQATDRFGLLTAFRLNITGTAATVQSDENELSDYYIPDATPTPDPTGPSDDPPSTEATEPVEEEATPPTENTEPPKQTEPPVQTEPDAEDEQPE